MPGSSIWDNLRNPRGNFFPFAPTTWYVGSNAPNVPGTKRASTLTALASAMSPGDVAFIGPGQYDEAAIVTFPRTLSKITLIGTGSRFSAYCKPTTEDQSGMIIHGDDVTLINLGIGGEDETSAIALQVSGSRFRASGCKLYGGLTQLAIGPGTAAQVTAGTWGLANDCLIENCEIVDGTNGIVLTSTDTGVFNNLRIQDCYFARLTAASFEETGGTASTRFTNLIIGPRNIFERAASGTAPTKWISLNDDNANSGVVVGNFFVTALNSGLNLVSTKLLWAGNLHPAGLSTTQPS